MPEEILEVPAILNRFAGKIPMLQRVFVAARSARSGCTTVHAAPFLSGHRRRHTRLARACLGPTARAGKHRPGITLMSDRHFFAYAAI